MSGGGGSSCGSSLQPSPAAASPATAPPMNSRREIPMVTSRPGGPYHEKRLRVLSLYVKKRAMTYDVVIEGGLFFDGTGAPGVVRHLGIQDGKVAAISEVPLKGARTVDAAG